MGRDLGELGTPHSRDDVTFGWFGISIRIGPSFSNLRLVDFMEKAAAIDAADEVTALRALTEFLHTIVHEEDWPMFWAASLDNGQSVEDLMRLVQRLTEAEAGRPTQRRADSLTGRRKTGGNSKADSSSKVIGRLEHQGRADLAIVASNLRDQRATG